jgi:hypothetical protein
MASYQAYINKLDSNVHISTFDEYVSLNSFRCNATLESPSQRVYKRKPNSPKSPNSMINNFDDISYNLRSYLYSK